MFSLRVNSKGEARKTLHEMLKAMNESKWSEALTKFRIFKDLVLNYFATRGMDGGDILEALRQIEFYVTRPMVDPTRKLMVREKIKYLVEVFEGRKPKTALPALKELYQAIREDWDSIWSAEPKDRAAYIMSLNENLNALRELEPLFAVEKSDVYKQYREILKRVGKVQGYMPVLLTIGKEIIPEEPRRRLHTHMELLFGLIESLMAPREFEFKPEVEEEEEEKKVFRPKI